jgi:hypothetical protein
MKNVLAASRTKKTARMLEVAIMVALYVVDMAAVVKRPNG